MDWLMGDSIFFLGDKATDTTDYYLSTYYWHGRTESLLSIGVFFFCFGFWL